MTKQHAYLIIAHNNWKILEKLLILLDDNRNDIYLHIDQKSDFIDFSNKVHNANLFVFHEIDVRWGDVSLIQVELFLFNAAYCKGNYSYYHLISGSDLPLKTQDEIHAFFDSHYPAEFIGFSLGMICNNRVNKIHIFPKYQRIKNRWGNKVLFLLRCFSIFLQNILNYNHYKLKDKLMMGPEWVSITEQAVSLILSKEKVIMKQYRFSSCADEVYKQTIIGNSPLFDNIFDKANDYKGCMRFIDWTQGNPYIFRSVDFKQLMSSDRMFARKFDEKIDFDIVERIVESLDKPKR
ncbi:beta-1,6-N-acetylglucosaminyltransferase [Phocaeicola sp.]